MKDSDLIRRSDVQHRCRFKLDEHGEWILAADIIKLPAVDAVEVVRCRECTKDWCDHWHKDGYCSWGKRREDGDA